MPLSSVRTAIDPHECQADAADVKTKKPPSSRHNALIARYLEFLANNPSRPLCLTEICVAIGVPERTLRDACVEHLGMGPIRYLTLRRMDQVYCALVCADASKTTVTRIAMDHGFRELGHFSVAYRSLFCESPSETLRRPVDFGSRKDRSNDNSTSDRNGSRQPIDHLRRVS